MHPDVLSEATECLADCLNRFGLVASAEERRAAAQNVATQMCNLNVVQGVEAPQDANTASAGFARTDIAGLLRHAAAAPVNTMAKAQSETGCFLDMFTNAPQRDGMAVALKDIFRFANHHPTAGLPRAQDSLDLPCSPLIQRLEQAGAQIVATTKLSIWCYLPLEFNEHVAPPRHPAAADLLVGGSSSGAAVAVASGAVSVALGSDTGGSTRIPAALTGIYGFKPSRHAIDTRGTVPLGETQDTIGLLARSATDLQAVFTTLTRLPFLAHEEGPPPCIALPKGAFRQADPSILAARDTVLAQLKGLDIAAQTGAELDLERMNAAAGLITGYEAAQFHAPRMAEFSQDYPETVKARLYTGMAVSARMFDAAQNFRRASLPRVLETVFGNCGYVMCPVVNRHAIARPEGWPDVPPQKIGALSLEVLSMNRWVNLLGLPAVSLPVASPGARSAAIQIVGRPNSDHHLLQLVRDLATLHP